MILPTDNYQDYEVGFFVGDECRGHGFLVYYDGDLYPVTNFEPIHYNAINQEVSFKLFDHINQIEYTFCTSSETVLTGVDYWEPVYLYFSSSFDLVINPYTNGENNGWYFITSPLNVEVNPEDVLNMTEPYEYDLYAFDQNGDDNGKEWLNYKAGEFESLVAGKGYLYANAGEDGEPVTLTFVGAPYNGDGEVQLEYSNSNGDPSMHGWNLVGNPFNQTAYLDRGEYYRMNADGSELIAGQDDEGIGAMEGIFEKAQANGETVTFSTTQKSAQGQIVLNVTQNRSSNIIDRAIVRFGQGGVLPKFMLNENNSKMYISKEGNDFAVVRCNNVDRIPVSFNPAQEGTYTISVNAENLKVKYLHLIDNELGMNVDLRQNPNYSFDAKANENPNRFELVFKVGVGFNPFNQLLVKDDASGFGFFRNGEWIINNEGNALLQVIDVNGQILISEEINGSVSKHINAAPGVYILRLVNGKDEKVQKIVVE